MRGKIRNIIGTVLIIVGIALIGTTAWMKYKTYTEQKAILDTFKNMQFEVDESADNTGENLNKDDEKSDDKNNKKSDKKVENSKKPVSEAELKQKAIGILNIPKINLEIGIIEGVDYEDIKFVVGHFPGSPYPGEKGNFAIAGHRVSYFGQAFKDINKLKDGDEIKVSYKGKEYVYEVTDIFEITPQDTYVLDKTDDATITIITCTLDAKNRVAVKGKLKS
ncbi:class D sortase [Clostridium tarantellae]|uniref:Sortase n=1 Tax=Clostridium tarantellae TaxID=39493 RepID=A0A6I1MTH5_9CLOT|nr:class D sortase [Clostridium tarantellae]MPQ44171.1 sortase [Clostridium tarantellae]